MVGRLSIGGLLLVLVVASGLTVGIDDVVTADVAAAAATALDVPRNNSQLASGDDAGSSRYHAAVTDIRSVDTVEIRRSDGSEETVELAGIATLPIAVRDCRPRVDAPGGEPAAAEQNQSRRKRTKRPTRLVPASMRPGSRVIVEPIDRERSRPDGRHRSVSLYTADAERSINAELLRGGWANVERNGPARTRDRFGRIVSRAKDRGRGAWRCLENDWSLDGIPSGDTDDLGILRVEPSQNTSRDRIVLWNRRDRRLGFGGWRLRTADGDTYRLPNDFNVIGRGKVVLSSGSGRSRPHHVYMGRSQPFVGRSSTVELLSPDGTVADRRGADAGDDPRPTVPLREGLPRTNRSEADVG